MKIKNIREQLVHFSRFVTVEPIIVLVFIGYVFGNTQQSPQIYRRICEIYYGKNYSVDCYRISDPNVEDDVQENSAMWSLYNALAYLVPAIFADMVLGAYGDKHGRQINILLGICGLAVSEFGYLLTLSHSAATPYWSTLLFGFGTGMTGFIAMIPISCYAYLADITDDPDVLTIRSGIFSIFQTFACVLGGLLAAFVHDHIGIAVAIDIELFMFVLAFFYTIWRIPQKPGLLEIENRTRLKSITSQSSIRQVRSFLSDVFTLYKEAVHTYKRERIGHRRSFMFITVVIMMLTYTTSVETRTSGVGSVINNFVFRRTDIGSLKWDSENLGYWNGMGYMMLIVGTMLGLLIFKKFLGFRETTLILIGIMSSTLRAILIGVAESDWMMYAANATGMFAGLVQPAVVSFITQIIAGSEVGRAFSLFGIGADLAFILTTAVYTNVYRWTIKWLPGFTFFLIAGLQMICFFAMLWVHFQSQKEGIGKHTREVKPAPIQKAISRIGEESIRHDFAHAECKPAKLTKRQISIQEVAEELARKKNERALWGSQDDISRTRNCSVRYY